MKSGNRYSPFPLILILSGQFGLAFPERVTNEMPTWNKQDDDSLTIVVSTPMMFLKIKNK